MTADSPSSPVIAGNWKMHHGPAAARRFLQNFPRERSTEPPREIIIFPPAVSLPAAVAAAGSTSGIEFGVQNIHWEPEGAFTGEISAEMARDAGAHYCLVGHSERRHVFGESDREVGLKVAAAAGEGLVPVVCVGETLEQRREGRVDEVVVRQLTAALDEISEEEDPMHFLVAYEPVWAIGTGETATPDDAAAAHGTLRRYLEERIGEAAAHRVPILYGGSVKPSNAADLLSTDQVDGVLVGGASLEPGSFAEIAAA